MVVNGTSNVINYGICSTAAATAAKVVSCSNFGLITGAEITVKFTTTNTAANPTLNINSTGAKAIYYRGSAISAGYLAANRTYTFRYNGSQYDLVGDLDTNTTYSAGAGLTLSGTQFKHSNSVTAGTAQGDANKTLTFGGTFTIPTVSYDAQGHITGKGTTTMTMPANPNTDTRVTQTAVEASGYTNWRPLILGASNGGTEGFTPGTTTDGVYTTQTLSCQPSSGTIKANTFKGTATKATQDGNGNTITSYYLPKTSFEYNKELALGSSGKVCIGKFPCYDSNISVEIKSTTNITYNGTLIIATQNINTSLGGVYTAVVYGDENNTLTNSIKIGYVSGSNVFSVYINLPPWSKNILHIQCVALRETPTDIATIVDSIPSTATIVPTNAFTHTHSYAGSSSAGGSANSAVKLDTATAGDSNTPVYFSGGKPVACTSLDLSTSGNAASATKVNNKLTVGSKTFDGSAAVTISASDLGLASAMLFLGTTTTAITDGATTNPIKISGANKTATAGNVVLYGSKEFVWTGSAWEELGNEGSYKIVQSAVADPSASGTSNTFIATISQDTNGKITVSKKTVAVTNSAPTLSWGATSTIGSVAGTNLQVKMPANPNTDTKVTQTVTTSNATYPLLLAPSGQTSTATTTSYFDSGVTLNPSTNTIAANISGNAATASSVAWGNVSGKPSSYTPSSHTHDQYLPLSAGESKKLTGPLGLTKNVNYGTSLPSSGFTGQLFFLEDGDVSQGDLPIASATVSGIVTTGTQTFAGNKTFNNNVYFGANGGYGYVDSNGIHGAMWNDYAEFRNQFEDIEPGYCVASTDDGKVYKTTEKFQACDGIVSDTFGFSIGKTDECKTPLAVAGRVLAYCEGERSDYHAGDTVCAGVNGLVCKMTREEIKEYPDRIIGIVSEIPDYEIWGSGNVPVNGRIWIKVK